MKKITGMLFVALMMCIQAVFAASPIGYWRTIDDVTGQTKAIIKIWEQSHQLFGQIVKTFPGPGESPICIACQGELHNRPIIGMVIMNNLKQDRNGAWIDGSILDPKNGKSYHCNIQVNNDGKSLNVRGYIGMPLFGRSQTWVKVDAMG